jgi:4'-phosphopantetheinyl transferase
VILWRGDLCVHGAGPAVVVAQPAADDLSPTPRDLAEAPTGASRTAFLRRRALTRRVVAARLGVAPDAVEIGHDPRGAPRILAPHCGLYLSVSGRDGFCALAIAGTPVGVDIEPLAQDLKPPWTLLHPREAALLRSLDPDARGGAFLRLWTAKEAYLKAWGEGFSREPSHVAIDLDFDITDEGSAPRVVAREWRRFALGGADFLAACVVLG